MHCGLALFRTGRLCNIECDAGGRRRAARCDGHCSQHRPQRAFSPCERGRFRQDEGVYSALYLSGLRHGAGPAARSRSGDAVGVAAACRIPQGRRRRNELRRRRCADGREDSSRRHSSTQFRCRSACPGQCDAGLGRSNSAQGRASGIRKRVADVECRDRPLRQSGEDRSNSRGGCRWRDQRRGRGAGLRSAWFSPEICC